jgi:hypothetical protein
MTILQAFYYSGKSVINLKTYFSFKPKKLRFQNENAYSGSTPRTAGWICKKPRSCLAKIPTKGYGRSWAVDLTSDGRDLMGGGDRGAAAGGEEGRGGAAIAAAWSSPALRVRALQCLIFKKGGTGVKRRQRRTLAMTGGGRESPKLAETALDATNQENESMGRKRRARRSSPRTKTGRRHLRNNSQRGGGRRCSGDRCRAAGVVLRAKTEQGGQQWERRRVRLPLKEPKVRGDAPTTPNVGARGGCGIDREAWEVGGGADEWAPAASD